MFTRPPDISDASVVGVLGAWGIADPRVDYMPVGFGSHHWSVITPEGGWFLTVDDLAAKRHDVDETIAASRARLSAALETASALAATLPFVVAPLRSRNGAILVPIYQRYAAALYPHVDGATFDDDDYGSDDQRTEMLQLVARMHDTAVPAAATVEDFAIPYRRGLTVDGKWGPGPYGEPARALLAQQWQRLEEKFARYETLVADALARRERFVITHGEPHPANTIATAGGRVLIDWDTAQVAPPERDLWMVVDAESPLLGAYESARGVAVDPTMFELYKLQWDLVEVAGYIALFRADHDDTRDAQESWKNLQRFIA